MTRLILNLQALVSVTIKDKRQEKHLVYQEFKSKKRFWQKDTEEGFAYHFVGEISSVYSTKDIRAGKWYETKLLVIDKKAYYKPNVQLCFFDKNKYYREFDTYEEAVKWGTDQAAAGMNVKLELDLVK